MTKMMAEGECVSKPDRPTSEGRKVANSKSNQILANKVAMQVKGVYDKLIAHRADVLM